MLSAKALEVEMGDDSAVRVEIALRAAMLAKSALEVMSMRPQIARMQLAEVMKQAGEFAKYLQDK